MKKHYLHRLKRIGLVLLWAGLINQTTWAQVVPDAQWAKVGKTLAITTDGNIATTEYIYFPNSIIPGAPGPEGDQLVKYSVQGDQLFRVGPIQVGPYIGGQFQGYNYELLGGLRIAATSTGGLVLTGGSSLLGVGYIGNVSATGGVGVGPYDGGPTEKMLGTPDGGYLIMSFANKSVEVRKYTVNSQREWQKQIRHVVPNSASPNPGLTKGKTVLVTPDGGYLVAGYVNPSGTDTPESGWVAKLDREGNLVWEKLLDGLPRTDGFNGPTPGEIYAMRTVTDVTLSADGTGYALVGTGLLPGSVGGPPPATALLEIDLNGGFRRGRGKAIDARATDAFVTSYTGSGGKTYYAVGNSSLQNGIDPQILLVDPVQLPQGNPGVFTVAAKRTFEGPGDGPLTGIATAGDGSLVFVTANNQVVKLKARTVSASVLRLLAPTYDCQTGVITFNTTGGDGSPITFSAPGISRTSAPSPTGTVEQELRNDPKPILIMAIQSGQTVSYTFDFGTYCTNPQPPTIPTPPTNTALALLAPAYDCQTGAITFNTTGGDGGPVTFSAPGISRSSATSQTGIVEQGLRNDPKSLTITASQNGQQATYVFDFKAYCINPQPPTPPTNSALALLAPTYDCQTGAITFRSSGGNGSPVEYASPGITGWTTNPNQFVDRDSRTANDVKPFMLMARQNGVVVTYSWDLKAACGRGVSARLGSGEEESRLDVLVLGNPVSEAVRVEVRGVVGKALWLRLVDLKGRLLESRFIEQAERVERHQFEVPQGPGLFVLRASSGLQSQSVKILQQ